MSTSKEAWNKFINASFVKFCRENYPELEVSKITEFGFTRGFEEGLKSEIERSKILIDALERIASNFSEDYRYDASEALRKYRGEV
jgi:hypothetical protein